MGFVLTKLAFPIRWLLHIQGSLKKEDPRKHLSQRLALLEKGERDDYQAALALERGETLPPPTKAQIEVSKASFAELLEKFMVADMVAKSGSSSAINRIILPKKSTSAECVICRDTFESIACLNGPCGHFMCSQCVTTMAEVANKNEDIFPLQCCQQQLPMDVFLSFLHDPLRTNFSLKCAEAATPPNFRVYCPNKECLNFIGRSPASTSRVITCPGCGTDVCSQCKTRAHPGESCDENEGRGVRALAKANGWKTCPRCKMIVERSYGCAHMRCRCKSEFCYICGCKWGGCACIGR